MIYKNIFIILFIILFILFIIFTSLCFDNIESFDQNIQHKLCILSQFKNETMNLKVWIDHYLWQGVEKIYLIDNGSTDNPMSILQPYIDNGKVVYYDMPEKHKQVEHYKDAIIQSNLQKNTEWLIICDLDEFFYGYPNKLIDTIDEFNNYDIIYSNWRMFGSDGLIDHPKDIRKSIIHRQEPLHELTKYIFKPHKITNIDKIDIHSIDDFPNKIIENEKIRLNHYPIQSLEFFKKVKMTRGDISSINSDNVRDMSYFNSYDQNQTYKDTDLANMIL